MMNCAILPLEGGGGPYMVRLPFSKCTLSASRTRAS